MPINIIITMIQKENLGKMCNTCNETTIVHYIKLLTHLKKKLWLIDTHISLIHSWWIFRQMPKWEKEKPFTFYLTSIYLFFFLFINQFETQFVVKQFLSNHAEVFTLMMMMEEKKGRKKFSIQVFLFFFRIQHSIIRHPKQSALLPNTQPTTYSVSVLFHLSLIILFPFWIFHYALFHHKQYSKRFLLNLLMNWTPDDYDDENIFLVSLSIHLAIKIMSRCCFVLSLMLLLLLLFLLPLRIYWW